MSETINDKIVQILNSSKPHDEVLSALRDFVEKLRKEGETKEAVLARMQELRSSVSDEQQEDILLEIMDFLVGWCSPHAKIE